MIKVLNGGTVSSKASEEDVVPMRITDQGEYVPAGRHTFFFVLLTGSVQTSVGVSITSCTLAGQTFDIWQTAGDKWFHTASPDLQDNSTSNIKSKGVGTYKIFW